MADVRWLVTAGGRVLHAFAGETSLTLCGRVERVTAEPRHVRPNCKRCQRRYYAESKQGEG